MAKSGNKSLRIPRAGSNSPAKGGINHLFVVGIDDYTGVAKLNNAVRDAQVVRDVLLEYYDFDKSRLTELYNEEATRQNIMQALRKMASELEDEDNVILYFSGHGHYDTVLDEGYWVPVGASYDIIDDYISYSFIQKVVKAAQARHILLIVDSCYSGAVLVRERDAVKNRLERDPSRWLIASGRNEVVPDGRVGEHSPFAEELIYLLKNYNESSLSTMQLVDRLTSNVIYNSRQTPIGQPLFDVGHRGGQFFFHPKTKSVTTSPTVTEETVEKRPEPPKPKPKPKTRPKAKKKAAPVHAAAKPRPKPVQPSEPVSDSSNSNAIGGKIVAGIIGLAVIAFIIWKVMPDKPTKPEISRNAVPVEKDKRIVTPQKTPETRPAESNTSEKLKPLETLYKDFYIKSNRTIDKKSYLLPILMGEKPGVTNFITVQEAIKKDRLLKLKVPGGINSATFWLYIDEKGNNEGYRMITPVKSSTISSKAIQTLEKYIGETYLYRLKFTPGKNRRGAASKGTAVLTFRLP